MKVPIFLKKFQKRNLCNFHLIGSHFWELKKVIIGSWDRGQTYVLDIIQVCIFVFV